MMTCQTASETDDWDEVYTKPMAAIAEKLSVLKEMPDAEFVSEIRRCERIHPEWNDFANWIEGTKREIAIRTLEALAGPSDRRTMYLLGPEKPDGTRDRFCPTPAR